MKLSIGETGMYVFLDKFTFTDWVLAKDVYRVPVGGTLSIFPSFSIGYMKIFSEDCVFNKMTDDDKQPMVLLYDTILLYLNKSVIGDVIAQLHEKYIDGIVSEDQSVLPFLGTKINSMNAKELRITMDKYVKTY